MILRLILTDHRSVFALFALQNFVASARTASNACVFSSDLLASFFSFSHISLYVHPD